MSVDAKESKPTPWYCCIVTSEVDRHGAAGVAQQALAYASSPPQIRAAFKTQPADFMVDEELGFELTGSGEHQCVQVRKTGIATPQLVRMLARAAKLREFDIGYGGLKDRQGICTQWFSLYLPGAADVDFAGSEDFRFGDEATGVEFLRRDRNSRKIRRGSHRANRFSIRLRHPAFAIEQGGSREAVRSELEQRLQHIAAEGVPNYFGEQRFGRSGNNVADALKMLQEEATSGPTRNASRHGRRRSSGAGRGMLLSAARSHVFNMLLSERVQDGSWNRYLDGDVMNLDGSDSVFVPEQVDEELLARLQDFDIHPTGVLWGCGPLRSSGSTARLERRIRDSQQELCEGLERAGLQQARRSLRLPVRELIWGWQEDDLQLSFVLPPGAYATAVLRELCVMETGNDKVKE